MHCLCVVMHVYRLIFCVSLLSNINTLVIHANRYKKFIFTIIMNCVKLIAKRNYLTLMVYVS